MSIGRRTIFQQINQAVTCKVRHSDLYIQLVNADLAGLIPVNLPGAKHHPNKGKTLGCTLQVDLRLII